MNEEDVGAVNREAMHAMAEKLAGQWRRMSEAAESGLFATAAVVTASMSGNIVGWNEAATALFGYTIDEILGRPIDTLMPEESKPFHHAGFATMRERGILSKPGIRQVEAQHKDGHRIAVEVLLSVWEAEGDRLVTAVIRRV